jgi:hypothetical protein
MNRKYELKKKFEIIINCNIILANSWKPQFRGQHRRPLLGNSSAAWYTRNNGSGVFCAILAQIMQQVPGANMGVFPASS